MAKLLLKNIKKDFNGYTVLKGIDLDVIDGEFCVFVGPSGCGKSTLLRIIAGLEFASSGQINIGEVDVSKLEPKDRGIAMVFQSYALYPHLTVRENIGFGLGLKKLPKNEIKTAVDGVANSLQLSNLLDRKPKELSGGQRQRVAIGRAIVRNPDVFLFDEPLSNLDAALRSQMRIELTDLHKKLKSTMIYVTHDQVEAMTMADKIVVLNAGLVEQVGSPMELYNHPRTAFVAGFIGSPKMNLFDAKIVGSSDYKIYGIRPEHLLVNRAEGTWKCEITHIERLGSDTIIYLKNDLIGSVLAKVSGDSDFKERDVVYISPMSDKEHFFN